jgi:hypothetical protein
MRRSTNAVDGCELTRLFGGANKLKKKIKPVQFTNAYTGHALIAINFDYKLGTSLTDFEVYRV